MNFLWNILIPVLSMQETTFKVQQLSNTELCVYLPYFTISSQMLLEQGLL